jgi:hypothetical protein
MDEVSPNAMLSYRIDVVASLTHYLALEFDLTEHGCLDDVDAVNTVDQIDEPAAVYRHVV